MDAFNGAQQMLVTPGSPRGRTGSSRSVSTGRYLDLPAYRLDPEAIPVLVYERAHFGRGWSSSRAKNTLAALRISLDRRRSRFSRRSAVSSSRSALVRRSLRVPSSASSRRTHTRRVSGHTPRSRATALIGRSDSRARRTARSRNSGEYLEALMDTDSFLWNLTESQIWSLRQTRGVPVKRTRAGTRWQKPSV